MYRLILDTMTIEKAAKTKYDNCITSMDYSFCILVVLHPIIVNFLLGRCGSLLFFGRCSSCWIVLGQCRSLWVTADDLLGDRGFYEMFCVKMGLSGLFLRLLWIVLSH